MKSFIHAGFRVVLARARKNKKKQYKNRVGARTPEDWCGQVA